MRNLDPSKLDSDLLGLVGRRHISEDERLPMIVTAAEGRFDEVRQEVARVGTIRHLLERLNAISGWLPLSAVAEFSASDSVATIELAQAIRIT